MGASNFYSNASKIYAIEIEHHHDEDLEYYRDSISDVLEVKAKLSDMQYKKLHGYDLERHFNGRFIGRVSNNIIIGGSELLVEIDLIIRSGYYEHYNLDYNIRYYIDEREYLDCPTASDFLEEVFAPNALQSRSTARSEDWNAFFKIQSRLAAQSENWFTDQLSLIDFVEEVFAHFATKQIT